VLPEGAPGWKRTGARANSRERTTNAHLAIQERCFIMRFWERGVTMAEGTTTSLDEAAKALGLWQSGVDLKDLRLACPFVHYGPLAEAHERGTAVETMWTIYRNSTAAHVDHDLVEAAYAEPRLRALFPFHSHRSLNFSRCTGFGPAGMAETDDPRDAVALVLVQLPSDCGPAVAGTAHDLDTSDST
jgi:hypothetical protein